MPQYNYIAVDEKNGKEVKGSIEAATEALAAAELRKEGLFATKIKEASAKKKKKGGLQECVKLPFGGYFSLPLNIVISQKLVFGSFLGVQIK